MSRLIISYEYTGVLVILFVVVIILFILSRRATKRRVIKFGNYELLERIVGKKLLTVSVFPLILRLLALTFLVLAISNPRLISSRNISDTDFVLTIDTSLSMLTEDYEPTRLEFAKQMSLEWLDKVGKGMVGVVTFAGKPYVKLRPTTDLEDVGRVIREVSVDTPGGTSIGEALITSAALLASTENRNKTIILITDGRNNVGVNISEATISLQRNKMKVFAIGLGSVRNETADNATIELPPELEGKNATRAEFPSLDEKELSYVANATLGSYFRAVDAESFREALQAGLRYTESEVSLTIYMLFATCILFMLEWSLEITKYRPLP
jgi:Ca-activated chloride channel family protein